jgi:hypothetical protein
MKLQAVNKIVTVIILLSLFNHNVVYSQEKSAVKNNKLFFSLSLGMSIPTGAFKNDQNDIDGIMLPSYPGNATVSAPNHPGIPASGINTNAELMYLSNDKFGLTFSYFNTNNIASQVDASKFVSATQPGGGWSVTGSSSQNTSSWLAQNFLIGLAPQINVSKLVKIRLRFFGGYQILNTPSYYVNVNASYYSYYGSGTGSNPYFDINYKQESLKSKNAVYGTGIDTRACFKNGLGIILSANFLSSTGSFNGNFVTTITDHGTGDKKITNTANSFTEKVNLLLLNFGISYEWQLKKERKDPLE